MFVSLSYWAKAQNNIVNGHIDSLFSKVLNEKRNIWVHLHDSYQNGVYAKRRYPVAYLLDGTSHFSSVVGMIPLAADTTRRKNSGGGQTFTAFLEGELIPHIDLLYPTEP